MKKRIISALLAAVMLIAMVPTAAFAENENSGSITIEGKEGTYNTIAEAVEAAEADDTIVLAAGEYAAPAEMIEERVNLKSTEGAVINGAVTYKFSEVQDAALSVEGITFNATESSKVTGLLFRGDKPNDGYDLDITVSDCVFNGWSFGVGVYSHANGYDLTVSSCTFDSVCAVNFNFDDSTEGQIANNTLTFSGENAVNGAFAVQQYNNSTPISFNKYYNTIADFENDENGVAGDAVKFVANETALKNAVTTEDAYIVLTSDITLTTKLEVAKSVTIDGNGHTVQATEGVTGHVINVSADNVTIKNLTVDGNGQNVHGLHFYKAENGKIENVVAKNNVKTGLTVNASSVTATGTLEFINNGWESLPNSLNVGFGQNITEDIDSSFDFSGATLIGVSAVYIGSEDIEHAGGREISVIPNDTYMMTKKDGGVYYIPAVAKIGETKYATLADAVEAAGTDGIGTEIVLTSDITLTEKLTIAKSVTIDLGGNTVEYTGNGTYAIEINNADVVIDDSSENSGKIVAGNRVIKVGNANIRTTGNPASLVLNGGTLESKNTTGEHCTIAVYANSTAARHENSAVACTVEINNATAIGGVYLFGEGAKVTVNNGAVIDTSGYYGISGNGTKTDSQNNGGTVIDINGGTITQTGVGGGAIYHPQDGTLDISGNAVITGDSGIQMCSGEGVIANITGGTITATGEDQRESKTGDGFIPDGAAVSVVNRNYPGGIPKMTISGGSFVSKNSEAVMAYTWKDNAASDWAEANKYLSITGGTFSADPTEYVASGYSVKESGGKYTVYYPSTGGGTTTPSNPGETVTNPDGSTTTTVTKPDGTVTETTKQPDGSTTVTTTKPDGSSVTTVDNKDGSSSKTTVSAEGKTESDVKLPSAVVDNAEKNGEAVELPIPEVTASKDADKAPEVTVDLPAGRSAKVEIPVDNVNAGVVAVLVHADGTEEIIKTSVPTENGIEVKVEDGATLKIVDNSKDFADVAESHWGADAVDFAASREIFDGTSETTFEPETAMTRAMVVTVLARLDGVDTAGDVWYEAGAEWAKENGISDGTNLNAMVSREQLVTMLYRYAGSPEVEGQLAGYPDAESVSDYAEKAMIWAVENGIITGADGKIAPQGDATRVQVAAILMRFIDLMQ